MTHPANTLAQHPLGLTATEAAERLRLAGPNVLPPQHRTPVWRQFAAQMVHFFALMLWVAGGLAILAGMPQLGFAIFVVILLNGLFAFVQEYRAERASEKLRDLLPRRATVLRDGAFIEIDARELVPDDLVMLRAGDRISADLKLLEAFALLIDASTLTGESLPVPAAAGDPVMAGTFVVGGQAQGTVTATGQATRIASIAKLTQAGRRPRTPLAKELDRVVRVISIASLLAGGLFLVIAALIGIRLTDAFLFALGVVVALVPEGLLPTVTLSLAWGAQRMADRHALVRRLEAVETLGSTTFICTDKTGTLTVNEMSVVEVWTPQGGCAVEGKGYNPETPITAPPNVMPALRDLAQSGWHCSVGRAVFREGRWTAQGDPLDAAIDVFARRAGVIRESVSAGYTAVFPFDPQRRRMSVATDSVLHVKGAPDAVLPRCSVFPDSADAVLERMAASGLRVVAVARRQLDSNSWDGTAGTAEADEVEKDLELLGFVGIEDPPRPDAGQFLQACRRAGIRIAMVTGDHPATARAIATQVGLLAREGLVIEGHDLPRDEALLGALVDRDGIVLSRVTPEDKLRIARALRSRGHVVAMTGDGVNDGPALQEASIGIAMGRSGTDVAREAADLVLLDDHFGTIVAAIEQGRATFTNIRRFLTYHLTDNIAELAPFVVWALSGGRFPLALGVLQVLSLDIGTDILPALALGIEAPGPGTLDRPPEARHLLDFPLLTRAFGLLGPVEALIEMLAFIVSMAAFGWRPGLPFPEGHGLLAASGAAFAAVVIGQMANVFVCRSTRRWPGAMGWTTNRVLVYAVLAETAMLLVFLYFRPLARLLGHKPPAGIGAACALLAFPAVILADSLHKYIKRRSS